MAHIHNFITTRLQLGPDHLRRIAQVVENKADSLKMGDVKTAWTIEGNGQVVEFVLDNQNSFKKWNLLDYRISIVRDRLKFNAVLYDGDTMLEEADGVSPEDAMSNLKERTQ